MSFERACFFEIGDIISIHFRCEKCKSETVRKIDSLASQTWYATVTGRCGACGAPSGIEPGTDEGEAFLHFINNLGKMARAVNGRNLRLRLEVKCPTEVEAG
jgi:hypothetical protein